MGLQAAPVSTLQTLISKLQLLYSHVHLHAYEIVNFFVTLNFQELLIHVSPSLQYLVQHRKIQQSVQQKPVCVQNESEFCAQNEPVCAQNERVCAQNEREPE